MKRKVLLCVPTVGHLTPEFVESLISLKKPEWSISFAKRLVVHLARNQLCSVALEGDYTHVLFWDDDVLPPADALMKMLKHDKDIVMTPIMNRQVGFPMVYDKDGQMVEGEGLVEVGSGSMGFVLIKREVIEWMFNGHHGYPFEFLERANLKKDYPTGEDICFFDRAREMDFKVFCNFDITPIHLGGVRGLKYCLKKE